MMIIRNMPPSAEIILRIWVFLSLSWRQNGILRMTVKYGVSQWSMPVIRGHSLTTVMATAGGSYEHQKIFSKASHW